MEQPPPPKRHRSEEGDAEEYPGEFFAEISLIIANGGIANVAEDALWCAACGVQVAMTKEDVLAHVGSGEHKKKVALVRGHVPHEVLCGEQFDHRQQRHRTCGRGCTLV